MHPFSSSGRLRRHLIPLLAGACVIAAFGVATALAATTSSSAALAPRDTPAATASFTAVDFAFHASSGGNSVTIAPGGTVTFSYPSGISMHNVDFGSGPQPSSCTFNGAAVKAPVPATPTAPGWTASCTFATPGTYSFVCDMHPSMTGTVVVAAAGTTTSTPTATTPTATTPTTMPMGSPLQGTSASAVTVAARQTGTAVKGSVAVSTAGAGGHLSVQVLASRHALTPSNESTALAGAGSATAALKRAGTTQFTVKLTKAGAAALKRLHRLSLTVKVTVTPSMGTAVTVTRKLTLAASA